MAKRGSGSDSEKFNSKEEVSFEGGAIKTAAKSLAGESYEGGYPDLMKNHINRGGGGKKVKDR